MDVDCAEYKMAVVARYLRALCIYIIVPYCYYGGRQLNIDSYRFSGVSAETGKILVTGMCGKWCSLRLQGASLACPVTGLAGPQLNTMWRCPFSYALL